MTYFLWQPMTVPIVDELNSITQKAEQEFLPSWLWLSVNYQVEYPEQLAAEDLLDHRNLLAVENSSYAGSLVLTTGPVGELHIAHTYRQSWITDCGLFTLFSDTGEAIGTAAMSTIMDLEMYTRGMYRLVTRISDLLVQSAFVLIISPVDGHPRHFTGIGCGMVSSIS